MTVKKKDQDTPITQEEFDRAAADESQVMSSDIRVLQAQNQHFNDRVVMLRAALNRVQAENEELKKLLPADHRKSKKPTKKAASRR